MRWRNLVWQHGKASRDKRATDLRPKIAAQRAAAGRAEARTIAGQERFGGYDNSGYLAFLDIGSKYVEVGNLPPYGPQLLQGLSWSRIGNAMRDPSSTIAQCVDASASYPAAAILKVTGNQPAALCTPAIKEL